MSEQAHGALMDSVYRYQRHIYDASRKYFLLGRDRLIDGLEVPPGGRVLEAACGTGRNLIRTARRHPQAELYGFDISAEMLRTARANLDRAGIGERVRLIQADATRFDGAAAFGVAGFEAVMLSYSLSMIPDWRGALRTAAARTAPGGQLAVVDFGGQSGLPAWFSRGLRGWLARFHVTARDDLAGEMAALAAETGGRLALEHPFRDYALLARLTRPAG